MNAFVLIFLLLVETRAACLSGSLTIDLKNAMFDLRDAEDVALEFQREARAPLLINLEALNPKVNADIRKDGENVIITVMGGMLAHPQMNTDVLKLLLCHELGHLLGGPPLKSRNGWSSTEGQADYFSTQICIKQTDLDERSLIDAALALTSIYAEVTFEPKPSLDRCDEKIVERTNYGYPPVQCRLDTLLSGWKNESRPKCWYRE